MEDPGFRSVTTSKVTPSEIPVGNGGYYIKRSFSGRLFFSFLSFSTHYNYPHKMSELHNKTSELPSQTSEPLEKRSELPDQTIELPRKPLSGEKKAAVSLVEFMTNLSEVEALTL